MARRHAAGAQAAVALGEAGKVMLLSRRRSIRSRRGCRHGGAYLAATGGAAYLLSRAIRRARVLAFEDLGMEAIHEFELEDFPVTVAVDSSGRSIHAFVAERTGA